MFSNCRHHQSKRISHFCPQHDAVICTKCATDDHEKCRNVQTVEKAADSPKFYQIISTLESKIQNLRQVITEMVRTNTENLDILNDQKHTIKKRVKDIRSRINGYLDKIENDLSEELAKKYKTSHDQLEKDRQNLIKKQETLDEWSREIKVMRDHSSNVHLFSLVKVINPQQKAAEEMIHKKLNDAKMTNIDFEPSRIMHDLKSVFSTYGKILIKETASLVSVEHRRKKAFIPLVLNVKPVGATLLCKFDTSGFGNNVEISRGCFLPDDRLVFPDSKNKALYVCQMNGLGVQKLKLRFSPKDVCLFDRSRALVSCGDHGIVTVELKTLSLGYTIQTQCHCSALASANEKIFVATGQNKISVFDLKGTELKQFTTKHDPYVIATNTNGIIYWTNSNNNNVNAIFPNGNTQTVYSGSELRGSTGVAADQRGNVFVSGCESSNVIKITRTDKTSKTLYAKRDGVSSPKGIGLSVDNSKLMVINDKKYVKIFKA